MNLLQGSPQLGQRRWDEVQSVTVRRFESCPLHHIFQQVDILSRIWECLRAMPDDAPNVDDIRDTVITQIVEGGYVTAIPIVILSLYLFVQGYRRLSLITAIAGAAIGLPFRKHAVSIRTRTRSCNHTRTDSNSSLPWLLQSLPL